MNSNFLSHFVKDLKYFWLLLFLAPIYSEAINLDSLKESFSLAKNPKEKVDLYNAISSYYINSSNEKNQDSLEKYTQNALILSQNINYFKGEADALYYMGKLQLYQNMTDRAMLYFIRSLVLFQKIKDEEGIAMCNLQLGVISYLTQNYIDAINYFNSSADNNNVKRSSFALKNYLCAISYAEIDSSKKAQQLFNLAIDVYKTLNDTNGIVQCKTFIGKLYTNEGRYDDAIAILEENLNETYTNKYKVPTYPIKAFLASAHFHKGNYESAISYGLQAYKESINASPIYHKEATMALYKSYDKTGNHNLAYYFLKRLNNINDSISNTSIMQKIGEIKTQYIFEQEMQMQKNEITKKTEIATLEKRRIKAIVVGVSIALLITSALLIIVYKNAKQKQRTYKLLHDQNQIIVNEQKRNEELLLNILPEQTANELKKNGKSAPKRFDLVTVLFTDFKNFTQISETLSPEKLVEEINYCYTKFDTIITKYGIEKIKTIGDSYMCAGGLPIENTTNPKDVVLAAIEIRDFMIEEKNKRLKEGKLFFEVRIGINTGPVVAGIVGVKKFAYDIWGDTVNIASRIESSGEPGKVNLSEETYKFVKNDFQFESRGKILAKNKGEIEMYFVEKKQLV